MTILFTGGDPIPAPLRDCDCYDGEPWLWGPACGDFEDGDFEDSDMGICMSCGHLEECHKALC